MKRKNFPLRNILKGKDTESQRRLDKLFESVGNDPNICWYPSAENDYRDIFELSQERAEKHGIEELPDLFIHTDYNSSHFESASKGREIILENDSIYPQIGRRYELVLNENININYKNIQKPWLASRKPIVYLIDVEIPLSSNETINKTVIYFCLENINFLEEIIFQYNLKITHLYRFRDGSSLEKLGMSNLFFFLSKMNSKYLITDSKTKNDHTLINQLIYKHDLKLKDYNLKL